MEHKIDRKFVVMHSLHFVVDLGASEEGLMSIRDKVSMAIPIGLGVSRHHLNNLYMVANWNLNEVQFVHQ